MTTQEMERRRKKVKRLLAQGAGPAEIAQRLSCSRSTVYRDLDAIEEEMADLERGDISDFLRDLKCNFESVNTELWSLYHQHPENPSLQLGALKQIVKNQSEMIDVLQKVGVLDRAADELHVTNEGDPSIQFVVEPLPDGDQEAAE